MIIPAYVEVCQEIDVEVTLDDVMALFSEQPDPHVSWGHLLNRFAGMLQRMPGDVIEAFTPGQRALTRQFLADQIQRFAERAPLPRRDALDAD